MYEFKYHRPATVRQAANLLVKNEDAKVIAGGHTLVPVMKQRLASPPHLVDLSHIEGLDAIEMKGRSLVIGATAKHEDVAGHTATADGHPMLASVLRRVGNARVRAQGTLGGNLCFAEPRSDVSTALVALGASVVLRSTRGVRSRLQPLASDPEIRSSMAAACADTPSTRVFV